jgi:hypothetical protein
MGSVPRMTRTWTIFDAVLRWFSLDGGRLELAVWTLLVMGNGKAGGLLSYSYRQRLLQLQSTENIQRFSRKHFAWRWQNT